MNNGKSCNNTDIEWLKRFLDHEGRVIHWPSKWKKRQIVIEYMTAGFEYGVTYTEKQVNEIIKALHTFGDHAMLRRGLCDAGLLGREPDGSAYWLTEAGKREKKNY